MERKLVTWTKLAAHVTHIVIEGHHIWVESISFWGYRWMVMLLWLDCVRGYPSVSLPPLSSPLLPYSPLVHMYFLHTSVPSPGTHSKADDFRIQSPMTFQLTHQMSSTSRLLFRSYLSCIRWASDTLGQVHMTLWHPPLSRGYLCMGGLVLGGLVLYFSVYHL
jgi:hypothetical protein